MNPIEKVLKECSVMVLDGALATELESHGCDLNDSLWSAKVLMENPELIKEVHSDYFKAGADCAITASYQATIEGYAERGLNKDAAIELMKKSVQLAVEARDEFWDVTANRLNRPMPLVAASIGPYGAFLADGSEYRGEYGLSEDELVDFHRERMKALIEAGADILACETIPCLIEAKAIVRLLKEFPGVYAWISFSAKDGLHISSGESIAACTEWLNEHEQVAAVGVNCTPPSYISTLIKALSGHTKKPIIIYPNSGDVYNPTDKTWEKSTSKEHERSFLQWYEDGARLIGGCCRTTPEDIKEISSWAQMELRSNN